MTTNYYFTLTFFTRKPRAEGYTDHKVYVRISAAGQYTDLYIGRSVNPDNWDQKRKMSKGRSRRDLELNHPLPRRDGPRAPVRPRQPHPRRTHRPS